MRVLLLSWEYPPLIVGGLGRHVEALARTLAAGGHDVRVVTRGGADVPIREKRDGVIVHRAAVDPLAIDFTTESLLAWSQALEHGMVRVALPLVRRWRPDVVHAHDWLVAQTASTVRTVTPAPLVVTFHATEAGRHRGGLPAPLNLAIDSVERWLGQRADRVITCSSAMRDEVVEALGVDPFRIHTVPNGIDPAAWQVDAGRRDTARAERLGSAAAPGPMIVFAGRLVHEKGVQTLIDALALLRDDHPGIRLVVAGTGPYEQRLRGRARSRRVARLVEWAGFVADDELAALLASADVAVVPSHYEPFGIVALEAAACRTPLVVTQTGGLADLIAAGLPSAVAPPEDAAALAKAIGVVLADAPAARRHAARAARTVGRTFSWDAVGTRTAEIYAEVIRAPAGR